MSIIIWVICWDQITASQTETIALHNLPRYSANFPYSYEAQKKSGRVSFCLIKIH
jgi:hypothetical protein